MADFAQTFIPAFQLGASLYDRAQQTKMENQRLQQQGVQLLLQQKQAELQNQLGNMKLAQDAFTLGEAQSEAKASAEDAVPFNDFQNRVVNWSIDPKADDAAIGTVPLFKSKAAKAAAADLVNKAVITRQNKLAAALDGAARGANAAILQNHAKNIAAIQSVPGQEFFVQENASILDPATGKIDQAKYDQVAGAAARVIPLIRLAGTLTQGAQREKLMMSLPDAMAGRPVDPALSLPPAAYAAVATADNLFDTLKENSSIGPSLTEADRAEVRTKARNGALKVDAKTASDLNASNGIVKQLDIWTQKIDEFNKAHGPKAFDDYVGRIDAPTFQLRGSALGLKDDAQKEAKAIQSGVAQAIQEYRKANFGTALTPTENEVLSKFAPDPKNATYSMDVKNFADTLRTKMQVAVSKNWFAPQLTGFIDEYFKPEFKGGFKGRAAAPAVYPANQPQKVGRFTLEVVQ